jgi:hypothetical protein
MTTLKKRGNYPYLNSDISEGINPSIIDPVIKRHMDLIDNFSYVTFDLARFPNSNISKIYISDKPQLN